MKFFSHYSPQEKNLKNKIYKENKEQGFLQNSYIEI